MTTTITRTDLAELYDAIGWTGAAQTQRELAATEPDAEPDAEAERYREEFEELDARADRLLDLLAAAPAPSKDGEHDGACWRTHAGCLASKVRQVVQGEA